MIRVCISSKIFVHADEQVSVSKSIYISARRRTMPSLAAAAKQANIDKQTIEILKTSVASLRSQLGKVKEVADNERLAVRALRRERHADIKAAREEETKKYDCLLVELKNR